MAKKSTDQRIRLTRKLLKDALVQLMQKQHISEISVRSLCELADINRSTFYAHYTDPFDLLRQIGQEVMENLKSHLEKQDYQHNRPLSAQMLTQILEYAKDNAEVFKVLFSENCDFDFQKDIMDLSQIVSFQLNPKYDEQVRGYITVYGITGCMSLLQKWLQGGMIEPPEKISEIFLQLLYHGILSFE